MSETRQEPHDNSDSEEESEDEEIQTVTIDPTKLTPLSPEVISKQVRVSESIEQQNSVDVLCTHQATINLGMLVLKISWIRRIC